MEEVNVKIGFLIEKLRKEQMLTQVQLAKEIMSKNTLSFIETGRTKISLPQLLLLLDKLNITFFEFVALLPPDVTENKKKKYISDRLHKVYYSKEKDFEVLINELDFYCLTSDDIYYKLFYHQARLLADMEKKIILTSAERSEIKGLFQNYLGRCDEWHSVQWTLFINCMYIFDSEFIYLNLKKGLHKLNPSKSKRADKYFKDYFQALLSNGMFLLLKRQNMKLAKNMLFELKNQKLSYHEFYLKVMINFFEGIIQHLETNVRSEYIESTFQIFMIAKEYQQADALKNFLHRMNIYDYDSLSK
ncbi:hypothetical protein IGI47_000629 [Enterococcus sp. AZ191]|uniref:helix-turn-helix domain-containing protein n=1 Tax=Enterococcus sp. AZ191 TaxID=2774639 RepID=UPI003F1ED27C